MKKLLLPITAFVTTASVLPFSTSCGLFDKLWQIPRSIDGTNWTGVLDGSFLPSDYRVDAKEKTVTYWNGEDIIAENLVIPNYVWYKGDKFKVILDPLCFSSSGTIVGTVELNDWTLNLPEGVFDNCKNITAIIFHDYPKSIGPSALNGCDSLENIYVRRPSGELTDQWNLSIASIGSFALAYTGLAGKLVFTDTLVKLGEAAFQGCGFLTSVNLRFTGLDEIAPSCFAHCSILKTVSIPASVEVIGDNAFNQCTSLQQVITADNNQEISFGYKSFFNCYKFTTFSIEPIVKSIGEACFYGNKSLTYRPWLDERNTGLKIGPSAFSFCNFRGLSFKPEINLDVDSYAFADCVELKSIDFSEYEDPQNPPTWIGEDIFTSTVDDGYILISQYIQDHMTSQWNDFLYDTCGYNTLEKQGWEIRTK